MFNLHTEDNLEFASAKKIKSFQDDLLSKHLRYCLSKSPYYRKRLKPADIKGITSDSLYQLPFTEKTDIEKYNDEFLAVAGDKIADIVLSSGTTGKPTSIAYTDSDLKRLAYNEKQSFASCGLSSKDRVLLTCTLDRCFVAGLAYFLGIRALGAATIRNGVNSLESHFEIIRRMQPNVIVGVPSFLRKLGVYLSENGFPADKSKVDKLICIGEPLRDKDLKFLKLGEDLEQIWRAKAYSTYSSSEIVSTFCECLAQKGGHLHPELAIVEIVDAAGNLLKPGEAGEVVVTPLQIEGMPLVRFKTGDISFIIDNPCSCKRKSIRLGPILGRKKQMMKVCGTTLYPQAIFACLEEIKGITEYYLVAKGDDVLSDNIEVYLSVSDPLCTKDMIKSKLHARLRVKPEVFISREELIREQVYSPKSRKPVRFFDRRKD
jgi:phenylacetate-CoA ligase